jgi:hypothetical protein
MFSARQYWKLRLVLNIIRGPCALPSARLNWIMSSFPLQAFDELLEVQLHHPPEEGKKYKLVIDSKETVVNDCPTGAR